MNFIHSHSLYYQFHDQIRYPKCLATRAQEQLLHISIIIIVIVVVVGPPCVVLRIRFTMELFFLQGP